MKILIALFIVFSASISWGQMLKFKITGQADTTIHLVKYTGAKLFYADTAEIKGGYVEFNGAKQKPGMLAVLLPGQQMFEFIYNNEEVNIEVTKPDFLGTMKIKKSEENRIFQEYVKYISTKKTTAGELAKKRDLLDNNSAEYKDLNKQIDAISAEVTLYQKDLIKNNPTKLVSKIVHMSMDIDIPEAPTNDKGEILDSNYRFNYFRSHYFDHIDFKDDRLVNFSIFHNKLEYYFSNKMMIQHWDTVLYYAYKLCDQLDPKSKTFEYTVSWITSTYGKSKIMGMDKVYVLMADKYYCTRNADGKSPAFWMTEDKLTELCDKIAIQKHLVMGVIAPNLILPDSTRDNFQYANWINMMELDAEYTILYFWDPECGHCKKITPKLERLYKEKFKARDIEIYAVGNAIGDEYVKWKKFIRDNDLTFINVALTDSIFKVAKDNARILIPKYTTLESLNAQKTYDVFSTPRVFVLNKNKEIIAKQLSISQLEDLMDRLQNKTDLPKIFPPDPEEDEQMN